MGRTKIAAVVVFALIGGADLGVPARADELPADVVVAADGSGDFTTIQAAVDRVPVDNHRRVVIEIRPGLYNEKLRIDPSCITLRGAGRGKTRIEFNLPREEYNRRHDRLGPGVVNLFGEDLILEHLTIENTQQSNEHAFAVYGQPQRLILDDCDVLGVGGDTLSLWNTPYGMYYHRNCKFRGGVDFVCPRGWCYVRDSQFESVGTSAAIWQDGHLDLDMKFVLRNCQFDGPENFWLGRNHYPSQFYLIGCHFTEHLADKEIGIVGDIKPYYDSSVYERKYYFDCHRDGGDFAWFADNLLHASGSPRPDMVTPAWTFDSRWDPERTDAPRVAGVEVDGPQIHVYFSEPMDASGQVVATREDGSQAPLVGGLGTRHFALSGGTPDSPPATLWAHDAKLYATTATLKTRYLSDAQLPSAQPHQPITIVTVGDSTVASDPVDHAYQGWGWALHEFFDDRVNVVNFARNGRSSKSFRDEGWWDKALQAEPDYVLIQFGHNDNPGKGPERETDPSPGGTYRANLRRYVAEARAVGALPILVSPTTRRFYLEDGRIDPNEGNAPYARATLAVAREEGCPVIDLNDLTRRLFDRLEESHSNWIQPGGDRTHFTPRGALRIASIVAGELQQRIDALAPFVVDEQLVRY